MVMRGILLVCLSVALAACSPTDEAAAIRALIEEGIERAEAHDLGGLEDLTSDGFVAEPGGYPWREAKRFVFVGMKRYGNFRIHYPRPSITVDDNKQQARATIHFLIVNREGVFPELEALYDDPLGWVAAVDRNADLFTLSMVLRLEKGEWLVYRAKLTRFVGRQGH